MKKIVLKTPFITLGQLLKITDVISSGGQAKWYLSQHDIYVNDELDTRRGRKLYPNDKVKFPDGTLYLMKASK